MTWRGRGKRIFAPSAAFLSKSNRIYQPRNKNRLNRKFGGNNNENSNHNQHYLRSLVLRLVCRRAGRHLPWRVVAHRDGGNKLQHLQSLTKGDKAMPRRRLTPEERAVSLERRRRQRREYFRRYYREHREERMSQVKNWQERHREAYRAYQREYQRQYTRRHGNV
jgi:hypothetical protein